MSFFGKKINDCKVQAFVNGSFRKVAKKDVIGKWLRGTFIVNPEGKIVAYEANSLSIGCDFSELFSKVQTARFVTEPGDQACPIKYNPGEKALKPILDLVRKL